MEGGSVEKRLYVEEILPPSMQSFLPTTFRHGLIDTTNPMGSVAKPSSLQLGSQNVVWHLQEQDFSNNCCFLDQERNMHYT